KHVLHAQNYSLAARLQSLQLLVEHVGSWDVGTVEGVTAGQRGVRVELIVELSGHIVLSADLARCIDELPGVSVDSPVRKREQRKIHLHSWIDIDLRRRGTRSIRAKNSVPGILGECIRRLRETEELPQSFVAGKKEQLVFFDRASGRAAELMAAEGRLAYVEEIAGVESAVPMEIERRAVQ